MYKFIALFLLFSTIRKAKYFYDLLILNSTFNFYNLFLHVHLFYLHCKTHCTHLMVSILTETYSDLRRLYTSQKYINNTNTNRAPIPGYCMRDGIRPCKKYVRSNTLPAAHHASFPESEREDVPGNENASLLPHVTRCHF